MPLFPDLPLWRGLALWGSAALRQLWWQSGAGGLSERRSQHHLFGKSRTAEDKKKRRRRRSGVFGEPRSRCACAHPALLSLIYAHTHRRTLPLPLPSSLPVRLLHSPMLVWWTAGHSRLSCMEAQGGAGSPGKSHFLFFLFSVPRLFMMLSHEHGCCRVSLSFGRLVLWIVSAFFFRRAGSRCFRIVVRTLSKWWDWIMFVRGAALESCHYIFFGLSSQELVTDICWVYIEHHFPHL